MPAPSWGKCVSCDADNVGLIDDHCQDCHSKMFMDSLEPCHLEKGDLVFPLVKGRPDLTEPLTVISFEGGWHGMVRCYYVNEPVRAYDGRRDTVIKKGY